MESKRDFAEMYVEVRGREGRLLSDAAVTRLPWVPPDTLSANEWRWRAHSFRQFRRYIEKRYGLSPCSLLDVGCGNGWMSNRLAETPRWRVVGIDVNDIELQQAQRLFARENLHFHHLQITENTLPEAHFDVAVLAASVQYFPDLHLLTASMERTLKPGGEIHIFDSPFYLSPSEKEQARQRSVAYYAQQGVPEMANFYFHHLVPSLRDLGFRPMNNTWWQRIQRKAGRIAPFLWWAKHGRPH